MPTMSQILRHVKSTSRTDPETGWMKPGSSLAAQASAHAHFPPKVRKEGKLWVISVYSPGAASGRITVFSSSSRAEVAKDLKEWRRCWNDERKAFQAALMETSVPSPRPWVFGG